MPLLIVATPIGNLADCSPRAKEALTSAELIAAEDTRVCRKLLSALGLEAPPIKRYSAHTEGQASVSILEAIRAGKRVVLVTDAGTPCVSDPGEVLVRACHEEGLPVEVIPGPSAVAASISASGLPGTPHHFLGFPPRKRGPLKKWLLKNASLEGSLVVYESPKRAVEFSAVLAEALPERQVCLCREMSKLHEEILSLPAPRLAENLAGRERIRGELVFVIGPGEAPQVQHEPIADDRLKSIAQALSTRWGCSKKEAYQALLDLEEERTQR